MLVACPTEGARGVWEGGSTAGGVPYSSWGVSTLKAGNIDATGTGAAEGEDRASGNAVAMEAPGSLYGIFATTTREMINYVRQTPSNDNLTCYSLK